MLSGRRASRADKATRSFASPWRPPNMTDCRRNATRCGSEVVGLEGRASCGSGAARLPRLGAAIRQDQRFDVDVHGDAGRTRRYRDLCTHSVERGVGSLSGFTSRDTHGAKAYVGIAGHGARQALLGLVGTLGGDEQDDVARSKVGAFISFAPRRAFRHDVGGVEEFSPAGIRRSDEAKSARVKKARPLRFGEAGPHHGRFHMGMVRNSLRGPEVRDTVCGELGP